MTLLLLGDAAVDPRRGFTHHHHHRSSFRHHVFFAGTCAQSVASISPFHPMHRNTRCKTRNTRKPNQPFVLMRGNSHGRIADTTLTLPENSETRTRSFRPKFSSGRSFFFFALSLLLNHEVRKVVSRGRRVKQRKKIPFHVSFPRRKRETFSDIRDSSVRRKLRWKQKQ